MEPRNIMWGAVFAAAAFFPSPQFAQDLPEQPSKPEAERTNMLQIGGNYTRVNIKPDNADSFSGNLGGVQGMYEYRPLNAIYAAVKAQWREGNATRTGAERSLFDFDAQQRVGYTVSGCGKYSVTFFTGAGYRYLGNELTQNSSVMDFNYNEFYIPVGFLADFRITSYCSLGLDLTWMPQVNSTVTLIPLNAAQWLLEKRLANFLAEMPVTFFWGDVNQYLVSIKPFYEYWQDGASTGQTSSGVPLGLPGNTYNFGGVELNFGWKF